MKDCDCDKWADNILKLSSCMTLAHVHGMGYKGKPFNYCPWCGKNLDEGMEIIKPAGQVGKVISNG